MGVCFYAHTYSHTHTHTQTHRHTHTHIHTHTHTQAQDGSFALALASFEGHTDVIRVLLQSGARVEKTLPDGSTALMIAMQVCGCVVYGCMGV